ncbi:hypothetical protein [Pontibacter chinhatensis]|uniref:hypothetical protein n=1 Tax=Pontibacter chinhatensis TaxID=1436961 RepID=UPI001113C7AD|nr:hypothetical protein [Pontibacter chinhatensis]
MLLRELYFLQIILSLSSGKCALSHGIRPQDLYFILQQSILYTFNVQKAGSKGWLEKRNGMNGVSILC